MRKEEESQRITSGHGSGGGRQKAKVRGSPTSLHEKAELMAGGIVMGHEVRGKAECQEKQVLGRTVLHLISAFGKTLANSAAVWLLASVDLEIIGDSEPSQSPDPLLGL